MKDEDLEFDEEADESGSEKDEDFEELTEDW